MFTLSDKTGRLCTNDAGFLILFEEDGAKFPSVPQIDPNYDEIGSKLRTLVSLDQNNSIEEMRGEKAYRERNAYGQTLYEGTIGENVPAVVVALGDALDLSDFKLIFVNLTREEAYAKLLPLVKDHQASLKKKDDRESLNSIVRYFEKKNGIEHEEPKKGGLFGLFRRH